MNKILYGSSEANKYLTGKESSPKAQGHLNAIANAKINAKVRTSAIWSERVMIELKVAIYKQYAIYCLTGSCKG